MNILFFLIPKSEVAFLYDDCSVRMALEKMQHHNYSQIPILNKKGDYVGNLTTGDLLWFLKEHNFNIWELEDIKLSQVPRQKPIGTIKIDEQIDDLLKLIISQNYIPVVDDRNKFIGIITRSRVIAYFTFKDIEER
jgi:CBS domain-containing protein